MGLISCGFQDLKLKLGVKKNYTKLKAGIFSGPEIRELISDKKFRGKLNPPELVTWDSFVLVVQNFLWFHTAENYAGLINKMLIEYQIMECHMLF